MTNATFLEKLADGSSGLHGSSERLALLGKRAAGMYLSKEAESLTGAVARVAEEEPDLNADQLRRISESANQATWKEMFVVKGDRDTQFEPADSERVIEDVTKRPQEVRDLNLDYAMEPRGSSSRTSTFTRSSGWAPRRRTRSSTRLGTSGRSKRRWPVPLT